MIYLPEGIASGYAQLALVKVSDSAGHLDNRSQRGRRVDDQIRADDRFGAEPPAPAGANAPGTRS
jgi:hypothetical protein